MKSTRLLSKVATNFYHPAWWRRRAWPVARDELLSAYADATRWRSMNVMEADWDALLLLDGCRYDLFEETASFPGQLTAVTSGGSATHEFLDHNFDDGDQHHDTVYVTANPMYQVEDWVATTFDRTFHAVVDVWDWGWDEELYTVRPERMVEATREAAEQYPNKRLLVHFMQPHFPFIGPTGREQFGTQTNLEIARNRAKGDHTDTRTNVWDLLEAGEVERAVVWQAYRENLELALPHVETLVEELSGRRVVSSDHGNMFGEFAWPFPFRVYGHPRGVRTPKLTSVPWQVVEDGARPTISSEPPERHRVEDDDKVASRLDDLGYH